MIVTELVSIQNNVFNFSNIFNIKKYLISSLTPRLDKKFFIECQEVSAMPMSRRTPSNTSRTTSGGARSERICGAMRKKLLLSFNTLEQAANEDFLNEILVLKKVFLFAYFT